MYFVSVMNRVNPHVCEFKHLTEAVDYFSFWVEKGYSVNLSFVPLV
jgi:hypothetical protein